MVKKFVALILVFSALLFVGCAGSNGSQTPPAGGSQTETTSQKETSSVSAGKESKTVVEKGDIVSVIYTGKFEDGEVFDSNVGKEPFTFQVGSGQVIPGFDNAVLGMKIGEEKTVTLTPDMAYGERDDRLVFQYPIDQFPDDIRKNLQVGMTLYMNTEQGPIPVKVIGMEGATVTIDANHPLAGKTLVFDIKVVDIKPGQ